MNAISTVFFKFFSYSTGTANSVFQMSDRGKPESALLKIGGVDTNFTSDMTAVNHWSYSLMVNQERFAKARRPCERKVQADW